MNEFLANWRQRLREKSHNLLGSDVSARADTSDVTQEALMQFWLDLPSFRGTSETQRGAWAGKIAKGQAAKIRRFHLAEKRSAHRTCEDVVEQTAEQTNPHCEAVRREELARLAAAIEMLDDRMQRVIFLYFFEEEPFRRIAQELGCTERIARGIFTKALDQLRRACREP